MGLLNDWIPLNQRQTTARNTETVGNTENTERRIRIHIDQNETSSDQENRSFQPKEIRAVFQGNDHQMVLMGNDLRKGKPRLGTAPKTVFVSSEGERFSMSEEQYSTHLLEIGGIGSGKTNVFNQIVDSLRQSMTNDEVMIIFDTKGDFYDSFYHPGDIVIGNGRKYRNTGLVWNIYGEVMGRMPNPAQPYTYKKEWELNAREIMKSLFKSRRSSTQPFFADAAADLIAVKIISDLRKGDLTKLHTCKLKEFFKRATVADYDAMILGSENGDFRYAKEYYGDGNTPQALAVFAYVNSMISDVFVGVFGDEEASVEHDFSGEFAMRDIVKQKGGKVIFIEYDLSVGEVLGPVYQLLYDQALKEVLGRQEENGRTDRSNVYFICDELKLLGVLSHLDDGLNFGRSLGAKIIAGIQSVNQIYDLYGQEKGKSILSGFSNMFCFRTPDAETRKYVSEHFGYNYSDFTLWNEGTVAHHLQREGRVVEEWVIQNLERGEAVIDLWEIKPQPPFKFHFSPYKKNEKQ